jgi:hypothetical protein
MQKIDNEDDSENNWIITIPNNIDVLCGLEKNNNKQNST